MTYTASYNAQDQLTRYGTTNYRYTLNGDLETKTTLEGITTYRYNALGNLDQVILPNNSVIGYTYDAQGRMIGKRVNGTVRARYLYDGQLKPVAVVDGEGNVERRYLYALHANVPEAILEADGTTYRIIHDHLGSPRMVVNATTGEIVKEVAYDEFGNITTETGAYALPFGFAGGIRDTDTGLTKFGARWYDPEVGRWISKEPLGFAGSMNFYVYAGNDPVNYIDVNGQFRSMSPQDIDSKYNKVKKEYWALMAYLQSALENRFGWQGGKRFLVYKELFSVSPDEVKKIFIREAGPLITIGLFNHAVGKYSKGSIYIPEDLLSRWFMGDEYREEVVRTVEHELAHYFDEVYNQSAMQRQFLRSTCTSFSMGDGVAFCDYRYQKGTEMYKFYYEIQEAGAVYESLVY